MKNNKGFSLVELIVVIAIMAILAAVAVVSFSIYIKRANDAVDFDYLSKLVYISELYAVEHQLGLESVVIAEGGVKGPEDIALWIIEPGKDRPVLYSYPEHPELIEIYNAIGDWEFKGESFKEQTDFIPNMGNGNTNTGNDQDCGHVKKEIEKQEATCRVDGWVREYCETCSLDTVLVLPKTGEHRYDSTPTHDDGSKYEYYVCNYPGCSYVKIMSKDGTVIVPLD